MGYYNEEYLKTEGIGITEKMKRGSKSSKEVLTSNSSITNRGTRAYPRTALDKELDSRFEQKEAGTQPNKIVEEPLYPVSLYTLKGIQTDSTHINLAVTNNESRIQNLKKAVWGRMQEVIKEGEPTQQTFTISLEYLF